MDRLKLFLILFFVSLCMINLALNPLAQENKQSLSPLNLLGDWEGKIKLPGNSLSIIIHFQQSEQNQLLATLDSPDQGIADIPVDTILLNDHYFTLKIEAIKAEFQGQLTAPDIIEGTLIQGGMTMESHLNRITKIASRNRPQEPQPPFPYQSEDITFQNTRDNIRLAGTLTYPNDKGPFPTIILISGSGAQDRNEAIFGHKPFLLLADYLTRQGFAVLRYDDRGIGDSEGNIALSTSKDLANDVIAAIQFLQKQPEINTENIGLLGHSEGGIIAPMVALRSDSVKFMILMAAPGLSGEEISYYQSEAIGRAAGQDEAVLQLNQSYSRKMFAQVKQHKEIEKLKKELIQINEQYLQELEALLGTLPEGARKNQHIQIETLLLPWTQFYLSFDPAVTLQKIDIPVLALNGDKDIQVPAEKSLKAIQNALQSGENPPAMIKKIPGVNHLFQPCITCTLEEYAQIETTMAPEVLSIIGEWVNQFIPS